MVIKGQDMRRYFSPQGRETRRSGGKLRHPNYVGPITAALAPNAFCDRHRAKHQW